MVKGVSTKAQVRIDIIYRDEVPNGIVSLERTIITNSYSLKHVDNNGNILKNIVLIVGDYIKAVSEYKDYVKKQRNG